MKVRAVAITTWVSLGLAELLNHAPEVSLALMVCFLHPSIGRDTQTTVFGVEISSRLCAESTFYLLK
jgi:hypothetical protein